MRRRQFIVGLGSAAAWPMAVRAQQAAVPVIGLLMSTSREANLERLAAFREGLSKTGYVEMRNVVSVSGRPIRAITGSGGRPGAPSCQRDRRGPRHPCG